MVVLYPIVGVILIALVVAGAVVALTNRHGTTSASDVGSAVYQPAASAQAARGVPLGSSGAGATARVAGAATGGGGTAAAGERTLRTQQGAKVSVPAAADTALRQWATSHFATDPASFTVVTDGASTIVATAAVALPAGTVQYLVTVTETAGGWTVTAVSAPGGDG